MINEYFVDCFIKLLKVIKLFKMPGPVCTMFLVRKMFPGYGPVVNNILEKDARRRYTDVVPMVLAFNNSFEEKVQDVIGQFYDEFVEDKWYLIKYGLEVPIVIDDNAFVEKSMSVVRSACCGMLSTSLTREEYIEYVMDKVAPSYLTRTILYKVMKSQLTRIQLLRTHVNWVQNDLGINFGPII